MRYRWFENDGEKIDEMGLPAVRTGKDTKPLRKPKYFSRTMITGVLLAMLVFFYGIAHNDIPLILLSGSFFAGSLRPLVQLLNEPVGKFLANLLYGFSIVLFFGAIILAFL